MDSRPFPWTADLDVSTRSVPEPSPAPPSRFEGLRAFARDRSKWLLVGLFFLLVLAYHWRHGSAVDMPVGPMAEVTVLLPVLPLAKNAAIEVAMLREVRLPKKLFTKAQLWQLVQTEEAARLSGKLRARKDLAPRAPIFWKDLRLEAAAAAPAPVQIFFPKE